VSTKTKFSLHCKHPVSRAWYSMMQRCYNSKHDSFRWYGGRKPKPITVYKRWHDRQQFIDDMLPTFVKGLTLERKNNKRNYTKHNCKWATRREQLNNTSVTVWIKALGERLTLSQWATKLKLNRGTLRSRVDRLGGRQAIAASVARPGKWPPGALRGSSVKTSILTEKKVEKALLLSLEGHSRTNVANALNISISTISLIAIGKTWSHVRPDIRRPIKH
jgi:AraC-like DNA-binding protein